MAEMTLTTGQVISRGDGRLACDMGEVYQALNGLLDDNLMTHQLPRAGTYVEPHIVEACPWVTDLPELRLAPSMTREAQEASVRAWVAAISAQHGDQHTIPDLSVGWARRDPIKEAEELVGKDRVIPVLVNSGKGD
ncbi:hypothetical protein [Nesterenkonia rhizosphaerae]|uniref:DUF7736 domain-containing protein n=1 Tax=Nesterenkonia rhizosphaerae TaxID=1348272 RepID=A0ABP9FSQ2_9MICC